MFTIDIEYTHVAFSSHYLLLYGDRRLTQELPYLTTYLPTYLLGEKGNTCIPSLVIYRCFISAHSCDHIYK